MPKVYVVGAQLPTGGAYMAYRLGRIIHRHFGYALVNASVTRHERIVFDYDIPPQTVTLEEMDGAIGDDDILIANPSFSNLLFGLRLPGRKIMYAQGFNTYGAIDGHFDLYVSASSPVQRYLASVWGIQSSIIAPFVDTSSVPPPLPWENRPPRSALIYLKQDTAESRMVYEVLLKRIGERAPELDLTQLLEGRSLSKPEFLRRLGSVRYLVNLTLAEGFGLVPLEAMALGTMVTGLDGLAGRDYMHYGENCLVASFRELHALGDIVYRAMSDHALAASCVAAGLKTADQYSYERFEQSWLVVLKEFLGRDR